MNRHGVPDSGLENLLCLWVVYDHPRDFPDHIVVRRQFVRSGELMTASVGGLYDDIDAAREDLPYGVCCLQRYPDDDPVIVETWI